MLTIGVDVGGTNVAAAAIADGAVVARAKTKTATTGGVAGLIDTIVSTVNQLEAADAEAVGVGLPGQISPDGQSLLSAANLAITPPVKIGPKLSKALGLPVMLDNDANIAARGECAFGSAAGVDDVLVLTIGTGVGSALQLDGKLRRGPNGLAGEMGHMVLHPGGRTCGCGGVGHLEAYAGRAGMERVAREAHLSGSTTELMTLAGSDGRIRSKHWQAAAANGDPVALDLIDEAAVGLGTAIASVTTVVDLSLVTIGGGLGDRLGAPFIDRISEVANEALFGEATLDVVAFSLGDDAALIGAAQLGVEALAGSGPDRTEAGSKAKARAKS